MRKDKDMQDTKTCQHTDCFTCPYKDCISNKPPVKGKKGRKKMDPELRAKHKKAWQQEYYKRNKEKQKEYYKAYYQEHKSDYRIRALRKAL